MHASRLRPNTAWVTLAGPSPAPNGPGLNPLLPSSDYRQGRPFRNNRRVVKGIIYRYRAGIAWRDLPNGTCRSRNRTVARWVVQQDSCRG
ncbi:transposase [Corynebacterium sp. USCH3]|uniref:transposase n=1 Tax=Corynebacterium sp. USCH3 TaxID=3024840 RepID=UPI00403F03F1